MVNLLEQAINSDDGDRAARIIQDALGIESDDVANYAFPRPGHPTASSVPHHRRVAANRSAISGLNNRGCLVPKAYAVITYRSISDPQKHAAYSKLAVPAVTPFGARILAFGNAAVAALNTA